MDISLIGKRAFVCGSTQGIGFASAQALAKEGASLTLLARNEESLQAALGKLDTGAGQTHDYLQVDFSDPELLKEKVGAYVKNAEPIHILINNTGGPKGGPIVDAEVSEFFDAYRMHLACNHYLVQALLGGMKAESYGRIINVISTSVKQPIAGLGVSNTTRGAVSSWAKTLAGELAQFGITVNSVLPGFIDTQRLDYVIRTRAEKANVSFEEMRDSFANSVPARRIGDPSEIAAVIAFLVSPAASYVNGVNLQVDGGRTQAL
ncbi:MAG: SDR family oxidoreductase [Bacteroidota bacterium]